MRHAGLQGRTVESVVANNAVSSSLPSEITFENVFKGNSRYKVNISKTSDRYTVMFFDSNGNVDNMLSVKDLIFDARSSNYTYEGKSRDNSMVMKIRTPRPLDDFIANGVSSQESMNLIEQWDVISVGLFGTNKFTVRQ